MTLKVVWYFAETESVGKNCLKSPPSVAELQASSSRFPSIFISFSVYLASMLFGACAIRMVERNIPIQV